MSFHGDPSGKTGVGNKLLPRVLSYDDSLVFEASSGYDFGFGGGSRNHYVAIALFDNAVGGQPVGVDPLVSNFPITDLGNGQYQLNAPSGLVNFDSVTNAPATTIFNRVNSLDRLRIEGTLFPLEGRYYFVGVGINDNPGAALVPGNIIDFAVVYVERVVLEIYQTSIAGIDTATLDIALALAGHNLKVRNPTFINGQVSTRRLIGFQRALNVGTTPSLEDAADDTGIGSLDLTATTTPDELQHPQLEVTGDT